ncbi:MAG: UDP-N-acetylmuramoyl-tripeptide--D-alanyl-D-alanine ligase, partial [Desulfobacterales bacterium]|nr:UDP-N-acetylmuramoyl-tripeptide--D-alanyl-D-alanine ligase [Desulfobacterales bacterium]
KMDWTPDHILKATAGRLLYGRPDAHFDGVAIDSRTIAAGQLFVAIRGEKHDGHTFIEQVAAKGVRGIIVSADTETTLPHARWRAQGVTCVAVADTTTALGRLAAYQRGRSQIPVVAITGSNGKTTTRQMTTLVMARRFNTLSTEGNFNNEIGLPLTLFRLNEAHQAAVLELGMNHPGEMTRLGAICRPTIALITMVGPAHLEFLGSLEGVARAKGELMAQVLPDGIVALNSDDPHVAALARQTDRRCVFFGTAAHAQVQARNIGETEQGVAFDLVLPKETIRIALKTPGRFMVTNALAAATAGHLAGLTGAEIKAGLEAFAPGKGRLHVVTSAGGVHVIDDTYNANPASMAAAIEPGLHGGGHRHSEGAAQGAAGHHYIRRHAGAGYGGRTAAPRGGRQGRGRGRRVAVCVWAAWPCRPPGCRGSRHGRRAGPGGHQGRDRRRSAAAPDRRSLGAGQGLPGHGHGDGGGGHPTSTHKRTSLV